MSEIKVTQADRDCEEKIIKAMVSSSFLPGCFAAAHRQAAMIEGARLMRGAAEAAFKRDAELCDCFAREEGECACGAWDGYKSIYVDRAVEIILALDPASVVGGEQ